MNHSKSNRVPAAGLTRRALFTHSGLGLASAMGVGTLGNLLTAKPAHANDYKALVCIFLYGGNDGLNTIVPTDTSRYELYKLARANMALPVSSLTPMANIGFGLHPAAAALSAIWAEGKLAPVFNLGTLYKPLTKAQYLAEPGYSSMLPENLFSHFDQQILWENASTGVSLRTGWGGRASVEMATTHPVISVGGGARFGASNQGLALMVPSTPGAHFGAYGLQNQDRGYHDNTARQAAVTALLSQNQNSVLGAAFANVSRQSFSVAERLNGLIKIKPGSTGAIAAIDTAFAPIMRNGEITTDLGRQLYQVAKLIAGNTTVQGNRQIFFASAGGFDTHATQIDPGNPLQGEHAARLKEVCDAMACFYNANKAIGMGGAVTTFTQSDFGRTLAANKSDGTDHAWGNHHFVIGGAVQGGVTYGTYPDLTLGGPNDVGVNNDEKHGRFIPTTSVDQYVATLLSWFGATDTQLGNVLPNLRNFATRKLSFLG